MKTLKPLFQEASKTTTQGSDKSSSNREDADVEINARVPRGIMNNILEITPLDNQITNNEGVDLFFLLDSEYRFYQSKES